MLKKTVLWLLVLTMILALCACGAAPAATAGESAADDTVYELKFSHALGEGTWLYDLLEGYADALEAESNGRIKVEVYSNNSLGSADDIFTMFTEGSIDILQLGITAGGKFHVADIVQTPFLISNPTIASEVLWTLYHKGYMTEFDDTMHICAFLPTDMMMFAGCGPKPETLADFKGLKFRANSAQLVSTLETLEATPVSMPPTDVFLSLSQGVINGSVSSPSAMIQFGYPDACDYLCTTGVGLGVNYIGFNIDTWNSLPGDLQVVVDQVSEKFCKDYLDQNHIAEVECTKQMGDAGVEIYALSPEAEQGLKDATAYLVDDYIDRVTELGYNGAEIVEVVNATIDRCTVHIGE